MSLRPATASETISVPQRFSMRWTEEEDALLRQGIELWSDQNWRRVAEIVKTRDADACQQRWRRALRPNLIKGKWSETEDHQLIELLSQGLPHWGKIAAAMKSRTPKQCRERWCNYLDPAINHGRFTGAEDTLLTVLHNQHGNKWAEIARCMPGRTESSVKLRFNCLLRNLERIEQQEQQHMEDTTNEACSSHQREEAVSDVSAAIAVDTIIDDDDQPTNNNNKRQRKS